jgi:hypothetical protein
MGMPCEINRIVKPSQTDFPDGLVINSTYTIRKTQDYSITEKHRGQLTFQPTLGLGTVFAIHLPIGSGQIGFLH